MMKIVRLTTLLDFGGQERKLLSFTEKPELLQNEYIFAAIGYGGHAEKTLKERGFEVKVFNLPISNKNWKNIFAIKKWLQEIKPDVVHTAAAEANFQGIIAAKLANVPIIIGEEIGIPNHSYLAKKAFRFVYSFADKVIGVSQSVTDTLVKFKEIPFRKGITIYNPVSLASTTNKILQHKFNWTYVGRLSQVKNVATLIKAFKDLDHSEKGILNIVGDGTERASLEKLAKGNENIIFHGFQPVPEKFVNNADVFVLPSYSEGFGIAVVEAMFQRVPCLCSNVGGIPEFIVDGKNGWLFKPTEIDELVKKMEIILSKGKDYCQEIGENAYESVIDRFTVENYIVNLEKLYKDLVN